MRRRILARSVLLGPLSVLLPVLASAQTGVLDRGTFRLTVNGQEAGSETFTIRQDGSGAAAIEVAQGTVSLDSGGVSRELTSYLRFSPSSARAADYRLTIKGSAPEQLTGTLAGGRFSARIVTPTGEMMREYLASEGAAVVDDGVVHLWYFVAQRAGDGPTRVPLVIARQNRQVVATVAVVGSEPLDIGGTRLAARHLRVSAAGQPDRDLWVDASGRVLKLTVSASGFEATRTAAPG